MVDLDKEEVKAWIQESHKKWLDDKYAEFGKWTLRAILVSLFSAVMYFISAMHGWQK